MYLDLFLIQCILCFIIDISGAMKNFKKPFSCSLCSGFWLGNFYLIVTGNFNLVGIAWVCLMSFLSKPISDTLLVIREIFNWILVKLTPR